MSIAKRIQESKIHRDSITLREPLWKGPEIDGITFSMLSRFLVCRERFRIYFIEGLQTADQFNHRIEFGNMWHQCEEAYNSTEPKSWEEALDVYINKLLAKYPLATEQIMHWWNVCSIQFPIYLRYWNDIRRPGSGMMGYEAIMSEEVFSVPYHLPSGRMVRLRGKWDSIHKREGGGIWLQENKTKGDIQPEQLRRQLTFDLQTMLYLVALQCKMSSISLKPIQTMTSPIEGILYNVVRRPLSGGKHTIRQHAPSKANSRGEASEAFYKRLGALIKEDPEWFFMRWTVEIQQEDIERFKMQCLNPILEQLCDWWDHIKECHRTIANPFTTQDRTGFVYSQDAPPNAIHWRHPFGVYNVLDEGGSTDLDGYLVDGNPTGLSRVEKLFPELE